MVILFENIVHGFLSLSAICQLTDEYQIKKIMRLGGEKIMFTFFNVFYVSESVSHQECDVMI